MAKQYMDYPNRTPEDYDNPKVEQWFWCPNCGEPNGENLAYTPRTAPLECHCYTCDSDYTIA